MDDLETLSQTVQNHTCSPRVLEEASTHFLCEGYLLLGVLTFLVTLWSSNSQAITQTTIIRHSRVGTESHKPTMIAGDFSPTNWQPAENKNVSNHATNPRIIAFLLLLCYDVLRTTWCYLHSTHSFLSVFSCLMLLFAAITKPEWTRWPPWLPCLIALEQKLTFSSASANSSKCVQMPSAWTVMRARLDLLQRSLERNIKGKCQTHVYLFPSSRKQVHIKTK